MAAIRPFRVLCAASAILSGMAASAAAAGLSPPTDIATTWSGFYVGGQLGGAWNNTDWHYNNANFFNTLGPVLLGRNFDLDAGGVTGGGQLGFDYQTGAWLFGVEWSATAADLDAKRWSPFFPTLDQYRNDIQWLTSVTGRIGYAQDRWLAYARAGWAGAEIGLNLVDVTNLTRASGDQWANGWTVGGGGEYALGGGFSIGLEYDYADLDIDHWRVRCRLCGTDPAVATPIVAGDIVIQSVTARLNYRFGR